VVLDNRTGDFYQPSKVFGDNKWVIGGNVGLHWVQALGSQADIVKKTPEYPKKIQNY
jgi:hypothetical protein